jgi:hypothetical protein
MPEPPSNPPPKVTLEDLLRLKRHERPGAEYWERFDRELRARALRSFVQPEPLLARWSRALRSGITPWATAGVAALAMLVFYTHNPASPLDSKAPLAARSAVAPSALPVAAVAPVTLPAPVASMAVMPEDNFFAAGPPTYVVAALAKGSESTHFHEVAAKVAFDGDRANGVRYATGSLWTDSLPSRVSGVAY